MPTTTHSLFRVCSILISLLLWVYCVFAQGPVSGKVINKTDNQPVAGATVQVKGTKTIAQTGADGTFTLNLPKPNGVLVISSIGYDKMEVSVTAGSTAGDLALVASSTTLNDVVV